MLAKLLEILSTWFLLSLIVGSLVGRAISAFPGEAPAPGFAPSLETDGEDRCVQTGRGRDTGSGACADARGQMISHNSVAPVA